jgi:hypothetical protein
VSPLITHPDVLPWPPDLAAQAIPHPRFGLTLVPADVEAHWAQLQAAFPERDRHLTTRRLHDPRRRKYEPADLDVWRAACQRALAHPAPVATTPEDDAALLLITEDAVTIDLWVATAGFAGAVLRLFRVLDAHPTLAASRYAAPTGAWLRLRAHAASMTPHDRATLLSWRDAADPVLTTLLAWVMPDDGVGDALLAEQLAGESSFLTSLLLLSTTDPALLTQASARTLRDLDWWWLSQETGTDDSITLGLVASAGPAAIPLLLHLLDARPVALSALTRIDTDEAATALARELHRPRALNLLLDLAARRPERVERALRELRAEGSHPHASVLLDRLPRLQAAAQATGPVAPPEAVPRVLCRPPWRRTRSKAAAGAVARLAPLPWTDTLRWRPGQRERWSKDDYCWTNGGVRLSLPAALRQLGVPEEIANLAGQDDDAILRWLPGQPLQGSISAHALGALRPDLARQLWTHHAPLVEFAWKDQQKGQIAVWGLDALDGLLSRGAAAPVATVELLMPFDCARAAPLAAQVLRRKGAPGLHGRSWLLAHPEAAVTGLLPALLGAPGPRQQDAAHALRLLAEAGHADLIDGLARAHGVGEPVLQALRPPDDAPLKVPRLPAWLDLAQLPAPRLAAGALPPDALGALLELLAASPLDAPPAALTEVLGALDPGSCKALGARLVDRWIAADAPGDSAWALTAAGHLRADDVLGWLSLLLWRWPNEGYAAKATLGVDVLGALGTDEALGLLHALSRRGTSPGVRRRATQRLEEAAAARGLTPDTLADRLVPELRAATRWALDGQEVVARVEQDRLVLEDSLGRPLTRIPGPRARSEAHAAAHDELAALRKTLELTTAERADRLERAMIYERPFTPEDHAWLLRRPLSAAAARRLVWRAGRTLFRVGDDGVPLDVADRPVTLPADPILLVHPCQLSPAERAAWTELFASYKLTQPFPQLGRATAALLPEEHAATQLHRFAGQAASTGKIMALRHLRWRWSPQGRSCLTESVWWPLHDGRAVHLVVSPGLSAHGEVWVNGVPVSAGQEIVAVGIGEPGAPGTVGQQPLGSLLPAEQSEVVAAVLTVLVCS